MRRIAHHDHGQKPERMKFLRIIFGRPEGARKWRILFLAMFCIVKNSGSDAAGVFYVHAAMFFRDDQTTRKNLMRNRIEMT